MNNTKIAKCIRKISNFSMQKKMDKIPPPPPLPINLKGEKTNYSIPKIKASDLQNVVLKKSKPIQKQKRINKSNQFEPPSLEELQITISKLKKSNK